jgi:DNA-binding NtrC family response regulator
MKFSRYPHSQRASVIMITAYGTVENAVKAMQYGATNFIQKAVGRRVAGRRSRSDCAQQSRRRKRSTQTRSAHTENIIGKSEPMLKIFDLVGQVAASRSTILLQGESGQEKN